MEKYDNIGVVGEGSYGIVMKCRHKETGQVVAIKKFFESVDNVHVRKLAFREIRMLKRLRHENLVQLLEVFRRKKRFYLVFEYLDHTILEELESVGRGLGFEISKRYIFQVLRGLNFCHNNHIMHRDVKPENVLVSPRGVVKLCDFGFARYITGPNESCTDYVATRWYRAPELLVGDARYGRAVDTWAAGCLYAEMVTGNPLFPGQSDVDQLYRITKVIGGLCVRHQSLIGRSSIITAEARALRRASLEGSTARSSSGVRSLHSLFPDWSTNSIEFLSQCLKMDPNTRPTCGQLLRMPIFLQDNFSARFLAELKAHIAEESSSSSSTVDLMSTRNEAEETPPRIRSENVTWQMKPLYDTSSTDSSQCNCADDGSRIIWPYLRNSNKNYNYQQQQQQVSLTPIASAESKFTLPALPLKERRVMKPKISEREKRTKINLTRIT